jgi:phasin family protein
MPSFAEKDFVASFHCHPRVVCIIWQLHIQEKLMFSNPENLSAATKALFESQLAIFNSLASKAVEGGQKAIALNISAAQAAAEESTAATQQLVSSKDPQTYFELAAKQAKLNAEKAAAYGRQLTEIMASVNADFTKTAEAQIADSKSKVTALVDEVIKNAPAGSENAVAMLKSVIESASAGYEQLSKNTAQAVETVKAQVAKTTEQVTQAAKKTTKS